MIWGITQLLDLILNLRLHLFFIFFAYVWALFLYKLWLARKYHPYTEPYKTSVSVVVPIFKEPPEILDSLCTSLKANISDIDEIIACVDYRDPKSAELLNMWKDRLEGKLEVLVIPKEGKRIAEAMGIKKAKGNIVVLMDSDTILVGNNVISELVKPFADPSIGGVTSNQRIARGEKPSLKERFSDWMESMRCSLSFPAMSVKGVVGCLPGRCIAFRKDVLLPYLDSEFLNEQFMGVKCETGDDRCLTNIVLRHGFKTVYQSTAKVLTHVPRGWKAFLKQQLRWIRSSRRETIANIKWMVKKPFILPYIFISDIVIPILFTIVVLGWAVNMFLRYDTTLIVQGTILNTLIGGVIFGILGAIISLGLRQTPHLKKHLGDLKILPLYVCWATCVLTPLCLYGLLTMRKQTWGSRN